MSKFRIATILSIITLLFALNISGTQAANSCNGACSSNFDCASDYVCLPELGVCRGACNPTDASCGCVTSATTAPSSTVAPTAFPTPVTGSSFTTILAISIGVILLLSSFFFAL
jgi:hypothetical protein